MRSNVASDGSALRFIPATPQSNVCSKLQVSIPNIAPPGACSSSARTHTMISIAEKPKDWDGNTALILGHGAGQDMRSAFMTFFHEEMARRGLLSVKFDFEYMEKGRKVP